MRQILGVLLKNPDHAASAIRRHTISLGNRGGGGRVTFHLPNAGFGTGLSRARAGADRSPVVRSSHCILHSGEKQNALSYSELGFLGHHAAGSLDCFFGMCAVEAMLGRGGKTRFALEQSCATNPLK